MNASTVTNWLRAPGHTPDAATLRTTIQKWPWFVPARLMEASTDLKADQKEAHALELLQLYAGSWLPAYGALLGSSAHVAGQSAPLPLQAPDIAKPEEAAVIATVVSETPAVTDAEAPGTSEVPIPPPYTDDYFRHEGIAAEQPAEPAKPAEPQTLMVVMSFADWLNHYKVKTEKEESEARDQRALRGMWQREKLAAALEDDADEIPEDVFEMAVSSIKREEDLVSESLARILEKQEKWSAAADMYRKLALQNPAKSGYFAARAEAAKKRSL